MIYYLLYCLITSSGISNSLSRVPSKGKVIDAFLKEDIIEDVFINELSSQISNIQLIKFSLNKSNLLTDNLSLILIGLISTLVNLLASFIKYLFFKYDLNCLFMPISNGCKNLVNLAGINEIQHFFLDDSIFLL